jgi:hypothetical protein
VDLIEMAQVPRPMRETGVAMPGIRVVSMFSLQSSR